MIKLKFWLNKYKFINYGNNLVMRNLHTPILKQKILFKLKPLSKLEDINIFAMPSRIKDGDIKAMFNGLLALLGEKIKQEQTEKYLRLKLKYNRLKQLYYRKIANTNVV